jgi:hypothetical protein
MKRAMARQAEAEREKRAKIINAQGESMAAAALGDASDIMMAHPLALQLRNLQSLVEIGVDKNTTVVFPEPAYDHDRRTRLLPRPRACRSEPSGPGRDRQASGRQRKLSMERPSAERPAAGPPAATVPNLARSSSRLVPASA